MSGDTSALYGERQAALVRAALVRAARERLAGALDVPAQECGMHLVGRLPATADDRQVSAAATRRGVEAPPLSAFGLDPCPTPGLVLGYASFDEQQIGLGVDRLARTLEAVL